MGSKGPAGGIIFYDKGSYSDGWRYLEAASEDLGSYVFGYYRNSYSATDKTVGTSSSVGSGESNTKALVNAMGSYVYTDSSGSYSTSYYYAAKKCYDCTLGGKSDWYLPSKEELKLMYTNLHSKDLGSFSSGYYWSSTEYDGSSAYFVCFANGYSGYNYRSSSFHVRPIRSF